MFLLGILSRTVFTCAFAARTMSEAHGTRETRCAGADAHAEHLRSCQNCCMVLTILVGCLDAVGSNFHSSPLLAAAQRCGQVSELRTNLTVGIVLHRHTQMGASKSCNTLCSAAGETSLGSPMSRHAVNAVWQVSRARLAQGQVTALVPFPQLWKDTVFLPPLLSSLHVRVCYHKHFITFCVQSLISLRVRAAKTPSLKLLLNSLIFFFTRCAAFFLSFLSPNRYACFSGGCLVFPPAPCSHSPGPYVVKATELLAGCNKYC